ncbi:MAG TPA: transglycosylase SLT domain-containing protein [Egicoccus sp.]|nr:transglycosylase SLT domain-containing protein [Egicoccus sp.]HSK23302.1 transglycosylase SLT domain-containing protein [Egicoccus sp.]
MPAAPLVGALLLGGLLPGIATAAEPDADPAEPAGVAVSAAPSRLFEAERGLNIANQSVLAAAQRLDEAEDRARAATTELTGLTADLDTATAGLTAAQATLDRATADLASAQTGLTRAHDRLDASRRQVTERAVDAFKYGSRTPSGLVFRGLGGAGDLHEAALTIRVIDRLSRDDQVRAAEAARLAVEQEDAHARAEAARIAAEEATDAAAARRRDLEVLVERQSALAAAVDGERAERAGILAALEADADAREAIVQEVQASVAALDGAAVVLRMPIQTGLSADDPAPGWAAALPAAGQGYAAAIAAAAARHGVDARLLAALVWTESGFRPGAVSHAGAIGLAQLMPGTAAGLGVNPYDPHQNLDGGARFLAAQLDTFGRVDLALAAYNAGPARVQAAGGIPAIVETQLYVVRVLGRYRTLTGA